MRWCKLLIFSCGDGCLSDKFVSYVGRISSLLSDKLVGLVRQKSVFYRTDWLVLMAFVGQIG